MKKLFKIFEKNKLKRKKTKDLFKDKKKYKLYKFEKENKSLKKKRKTLKLNLNFKKSLFFLREIYIPYFFMFFLIFLIVVLGILLTPKFKLKFIEITKKDSLVNMNIAYKAVEDIRGNPIFSIDKNNLLDRFKHYQENIKDITLKVKLPNTINIEIESFKEAFNVYVGGKHYIILENGSFVPTDKKNKKLRKLNIVNNFGNNVFLSYSIVFEEKYIKKIKDIIEKLKKNILGIKITKLNFFNIEREIHIEIDNFTTIVFSLDNDITIDEQIRNLAIFHKDHQKINNQNIIYLDLRIKGKIFFCEKEKKDKCYKKFKSLYPETEIEPKIEIKNGETKKK